MDKAEVHGVISDFT